MSAGVETADSRHERTAARHLVLSCSRRSRLPKPLHQYQLTDFNALLGGRFPFAVATILVHLECHSEVLRYVAQSDVPQQKTSTKDNVVVPAGSKDVYLGVRVG